MIVTAIKSVLLSVLLTSIAFAAEVEKENDVVDAGVMYSFFIFGRPTFGSVASSSATVETYHILTESGDDLVTETGDKLRQEEP